MTPPPAASAGERRRALPAVQRLMAAVPDEVAAVWARRAAREVLAEARAALQQGGEVPPFAALAEQTRRRARRLARPNLRAVINATGVVLHTNLGRAPLPQVVLDRVVEVARQYSTLEFDVEAGRRGSRHDHVAELLREVSGAEAAMVVNNNAAAVLLALAALARGREVVVSRGELVEIGGSFRVPEIMAESGARLREVGATNKTHLRDYEAAIGPDTALILKVHPSNFRMSGFTASVPTETVVELGRRHGLAVMEDLGSGMLAPLGIAAHEDPTVQEAIRQGVAVVTCSGDKLLGGPQAGIVAGRREIIEAMRRHPLARAVRVDKMTLAALEVTLRLYLEGRADEIPLRAMLTAPPEALRRRALSLARRLRPAVAAWAQVAVRADASEAGGGSLPGVSLPTWVVVVLPLVGSAAQWEAALRLGEPPVVARVQQGAVLLDVRTILPEQERTLIRALAQAGAGLAAGQA